MPAWMAAAAHDHAAQHGVFDHRRVVPRVVGGHEGVGVAVLNRHAEGNRVVLLKQPHVEVRRRAAAAVLIAVGEEVLEQGGSGPVRAVALQTAREGGGHGADKEWVFTVGLLAAAPARVSAQVGVGRADDQTAAVVLAEGVAGLQRLLRGGFFEQRRVPGLAQAARLRKGGGGNHLGAASALPAAGAAESEAVQAFDVPGSNDAQPRYGGVGAERVDLFLERHAAQQVGDALLGGGGGIGVHCSLLSGGGEAEHKKCAN